MAFFYILGVIVWVAVALWPATVAKNKGHSFWGYFLLSIFFWFITLFIVYFGLKDNTVTAKDRADDKAVNKELEKEERAGKS